MLKQRIVTAIILVFLVILLLFKATDHVWQWIILAFGFVAALEWAGFAQIKQLWQRSIFAIITTVIGLCAAETLSQQNIAMLTFLEALLLMSVVSCYQCTKGKVGIRPDGFVLLSGILSIVLFTTALIHFRAEFSAQEVLMSLCVIWAIDIGAYFSGRRFGKTKLVVFVSSGKTWEGVVGGVVLAFIVAIIGLSIVGTEFSFSLLLMVSLFSLIAMFSILGDLFESVLKRQVGLKDSGRILPGHGGVLDRVDSLLIGIPMLYLLWHFTSIV